MTYLAYAGIGSRSTPTHIQAIMRHIGAYLFSEGWTLRSGGANGADTAFEEGVNDHQASLQKAVISGSLEPRKEIYLPWVGFNNNPSELHPRDIPFTEQEQLFSARMHPAWDKCSPSAKLLHQRNLRQMIGCEATSGEHVVASKFVVCWTEGGAMRGGTAQALRIAHHLGIPIVNLGVATNAAELEQLVLEVDRLQNTYKSTVVLTT